MNKLTQALFFDSGKNEAELKQIELPPLKEGQALIKIKAAALNHRDQWIREGKYPNIQSCILGSDGCGVVKEVTTAHMQKWVGREVVINPNIRWGDNPKVQSEEYSIMGMPVNGTFSEYLITDQDRLHSKPAHLSVEQAAALPLGGLTAYRATTTQGKVQKGQKVLVTGAGGGVAQFAIQFANTLGAEVYTTSGSKEKLEKAQKLGTMGGAVYKEADWHKRLKKETGGFDVIIDSAGGEQLNYLIDLIKPAGKIVVYGATTGAPAKLDVYKMFWKQVALQGSTMGNDAEFQAMLSLVEQHEIVPAIDSVRPFDEILSAFDVIKEGKQFGKLVVKM